MRLVALAVAVIVTGTGLLAGGATSAADADVLGPGVVTVEIGIEHSRFSIDDLTVRAGTLVRFIVTNDDPILHELVVGGPEVHARHETGTESFHPPIPGEVSVLPGEVGETFYEFDDAGTFAFMCHLPRHAQYGMVGEVHVVSD